MYKEIKPTHKKIARKNIKNNPHNNHKKPHADTIKKTFFPAKITPTQLANSLVISHLLKEKKNGKKKLLVVMSPHGLCVCKSCSNACNIKIFETEIF